MGERERQRPRAVRCWVVVGRKGHPFLWTTAWRRMDAITAFRLQMGHSPWSALRRDYSVVRCTLAAEGEK